MTFEGIDLGLRAGARANSRLSIYTAPAVEQQAGHDIHRDKMFTAKPMEEPRLPHRS
jgi:hypothetical protein